MTSKPRRKLFAPASDQAGISLLADFFMRFSMKDWDLKDWQEDLAVVSPVFYSLMHQSVIHPSLDDVVSLTAIWEAAGCPEHNQPAAFESGIETQRVEDRGVDGVWGDFETAAWYAESLCELIRPQHVCDMCY